MTNLYQPPLNPTGSAYGGGLAGQGNHAATKNPYFTVGSQFLPRNLHDVIKWARYIAIQSPVTTEVVRKLATYPITGFTYASQDPAVRAKYEELVKSFRLITTLHNIGFQYHTVGNVFVSLYFPIVRTLTCPTCKTAYGAERAKFLTFKQFEFTGECPACGTVGNFHRHDTKSTNIKHMNVILWDPTHITVNHNPISGRSDYYYNIPNDIQKKIREGDRLFLDTVPWEFVEAVRNKQEFQFEEDHIFHLKNIDMGFSINGIAVPPLVTHFNLVFYQATLRKANESIATDFMAPLRVVYPTAQTGNSDPVVAISMRNFAANMEQAFVKHKADNNHVLIAPVPIGYQPISGEGKTLLVNAEIAQAEESLLLSMGVSRELLSGSTNWTSSTVGLRMLKNTLDSYVTQIQELIDWIFSKASSYMHYPYHQVKLTPFQLTDDEALKSILMGLAQSGKVSMTTIYESLGRSYEDEQDRIRDDAVREAKTQILTQYESEQAVFLAGTEITKKNTKDDSYQNALTQAQQLSEELLQTDDSTKRQVLNQLKVTDYAKYLMVSKLLEEQNEALRAQNEMDLQQEAAAGGANSPAAADQAQAASGQGGAPSSEPGSGPTNNL